MVILCVISRRRHFETLRQLSDTSTVVAILGSRQVGKTTLARQLGPASKKKFTHFDLEAPTDLAALEEPMLALRDLRGLVVIDEIQRRPELFPILRVLVGRPQSPCQFLILGSASPELPRQGSESLAGRIASYELSPFALDEVGEENLGQLWFRGGFPRSFLASSDRDSVRWRRDFVRTFLERDLPALGIGIPRTTMGRFWAMLAHYHGGVWAGAELARSFGVSGKTVRGYLDLLTQVLVVRQGQPWFENLGKRQVKSPKVYLRDSGLLHNLLQVDSREHLLRHPKNLSRSSNLT